MKIKLAGCLLLLCLGWLPQNCWALCVLCTCSVTRADDIAFGNYQPFSSGDIDITGTINVHCFVTLGVTASIDLKLSRGSSASYTPRTMKSGSNSLNYNLYTDPSHTTIWGDGTGGSSIITRNFVLGLLGKIDLTNTVYGRLPTGQTTAAVGSYSDTIILTVDY